MHETRKKVKIPSEYDCMFADRLSSERGITLSDYEHTIWISDLNILYWAVNRGPERIFWTKDIVYKRPIEKNREYN